MDCCPQCGYRPGRPIDPEAEQLLLPRRYWRAYRYMVANLREADLTSKDIAEAAGVTVRALQLVWNKHLGCPPFVTVMRLRAERIRNDIATTNKSIELCGADWGINNRARLGQTFQKVFKCAPSAFRGPARRGAP